MIGRVRLVLDMPFDFDLQEPDETGHSESRIEAAKHAEKHLLDRMQNLVKNYGTVVDMFIEEVHEA